MARPTPCPPKRPGTLRLVGWNVAGGLQKKFGLLQRLDPDIAVVAEGCNEIRLLRHGLDDFASSAWIGRHPHKGLLVLSFDSGRFRMCASEWDQRLEWVLPVRVTAPIEFTLFGLWSQNASAEPNGIRYPSDHYRYPCGHLLEAYDRLLGERSPVLLGDFNQHTLWDRGDSTRDFAPLVERFAAHGLVSAWHAHNDAEIGDPREPATHWWQWNADQPYHLDYCFVPAAWTPAIRDVWVGGYEEFGSRDPRSDHAPIVVDLELGALRMRTDA